MSSFIDDLVGSCKENLIGHICQDLSKYCAVYYSEFALATALTIIGTAAQRSYTLPGGNLPGYHILVGPPGCGKNDYLSYSTAAVKAVDERLLSQEARHAEAVKKLLSLYPSRVYIADEIGDDIAEGSNPQTKNVVARSLCKIWLEIWDPRPVLLGSMTKGREGRIDNIDHPRWTMLGAMTSSDLERIAGIPEFANKGLYSRICMWALPKPVFPGYSPHRARSPISPNVLAALKKLHRYGECGIEAVEGQDGVKTWHDAPPRVISWPTVRTDVGPQAQFEALWDRANDHLNLYGDGTEDLVSGIIARAKMKALTFASLHCLASERETLLSQDVSFGWGLASHLLRQDLKRLSLDTEHEKQERAVIAVLESNTERVWRIGDIQRNSRTLKKMERRAFEELLAAMRRDDLIAIEQGARKNSATVRLLGAGDLGDGGLDEIVRHGETSQGLPC